MEILLSSRGLGYLALAYFLIVAFFALVEAPLPLLAAIAATGALILGGLVLLRIRRPAQARRRPRD